MRHVVAVAREKKIVQTFLKLIVGRRNDVVEPADDLRIVSITLEGKNFQKFLDSDDAGSAETNSMQRSPGIRVV
jgi:hypothetical protein